jgi:hypothetical protein
MNQVDSDDACPICGGLSAFVEIENAQNPDEGEAAEHLPPQVQALQAPNESLAHYYRFGNERLLKCPQCGTYYWYREWAPGGSEDVLHTYIHESVRRLGFLEAHVELRDALYQANRRAQEYGGGYVEGYESVRAGVYAEMGLLRARHRQIIAEAIDRIQNKYDRSQELAETLALYSPQRDHSSQLEEARERDRARASYYAGVLAEYVAYARLPDLGSELLQRLVRTLADEVCQVRQTVAGALLGALEAEPDPGIRCDLARRAVKTIGSLTPQYPQIEEFVTVCDKLIWPLASG